MRKVILSVLLLLSSMPLVAQTLYPTKQEVLATLETTSHAFRRFEEVTDKINFGRWDAPYAVVDTHKESLDVTRKVIRDIRPTIADLKASETISTSSLFYVFRIVDNVNSSASLLACMLSIYGKDRSLPDEMYLVSSSLYKAVVEFHDLFAKQLRAQELELERLKAEAIKSGKGVNIPEGVIEEFAKGIPQREDQWRKAGRTARPFGLVLVVVALVVIVLVIIIWGR